MAFTLRNITSPFRDVMRPSAAVDRTKGSRRTAVTSDGAIEMIVGENMLDVGGFETEMCCAVLQ